jgi:hypothetical protein
VNQNIGTNGVKAHKALPKTTGHRFKGFVKN